jgi:hypothetical protein
MSLRHAFSLLLIILVSAGASPKNPFGIPPERQELSMNCWAAACNMVLWWYGKSSSQADIQGWASDGYDVENFLTGSADPRAIDQILNHFGSMSTR